MKRMKHSKKRNDLILVGVIIAAALIFAVIRLCGKKEEAVSLEIYKDGELWGTYSLAEDQEIGIGSGNVCQIEHGEVKMVWADCPDQICVHHTALSPEESEDPIICLPNQVILMLSGAGTVGTTDSLAS